MEKDSVDDRSSRQLFEGVRRGDESAATKVFHCYVDRLISLAGSRLSSKLARRTDAEDVVQSACRSFFRRARAGELTLRETGADDELWHLLAAITINKVRKSVRRHTAKKRNVDSEASAGHGAICESIVHDISDREPSPEEAAVLIEETERMMSVLSPLQRQILQFRLQGYAPDETAMQAKCSERTVRRALELARTDLQSRLAGTA